MKKIFVLLTLCGFLSNTAFAQTPSYCSTLSGTTGTPFGPQNANFALTMNIGAPTAACPNGYPVWIGAAGSTSVIRDPNDCNKWLMLIGTQCSSVSAICSIVSTATTATPTDNPPTSGWVGFAGFSITACNACVPPTAPTSITKNPSTTVNSGTSVMLNANGCASGTNIRWENNFIGNPRFVTPAVTTTYSAKCINNYLCESPATVVTVDVIGIAVSPLSQASYCPNAGTTIPVTFAATNTTGPYTIKLTKTVNSICIGTSSSVITTASTNTNSGILTLPNTLTPSGSVTDPSCPTGNTTTSYTISVTDGTGSITSTAIPVTISSSQSVTNIMATPATLSTVGGSAILSATCTGGNITWYNGASQIGIGPSITVMPTNTTTYTLTCVDPTSGCSADGSVTVPLIVNLSGTGVTSLTGDFKEIACTNCNTTNPYSYSKNFSSSSCGQYGVLTCTTENKIVRTNNVWELNQTYKDAYGAVTITRLYHTKSLYNSQRPPCTATWINDSNGSEITLTMTGVCENEPICSAINIVSSVPNPITVGYSTTLTVSGCSSPNVVTWNTGATGSTLVISPTVTSTYSASCFGTSCSSSSASIDITVYNPCPTSLVLSSTNVPTDDVNSGIVDKNANATNGSISATNKITGTANVTYQARSIELKDGFKAENGTVFKAQVGGCN